jgi:nitroreductase
VWSSSEFQNSTDTPDTFLLRYQSDDIDTTYIHTYTKMRKVVVETRASSSALLLVLLCFSLMVTNSWGFAPSSFVDPTTSSGPLKRRDAPRTLLFRTTLHMAATKAKKDDAVPKEKGKREEKEEQVVVVSQDEDEELPEQVAVVPSSFQNLLLSRRTINDFATTLPDQWEEALERAIEAATYAPNHKRTEPWRFHLLGKRSIKRVCELNSKLVAAQKGKEAGKKKLKRWLAMPGWLVVTCAVQKSRNSIINNSEKVDDDDDEIILSSSMDDPTGMAREDYAACCCAVQNLCLSLHADGIGTKWTTGPVNFDPRFAKAVGLSSEEYVVGTIWFGTAENIPKPPAKKLSVADVLIKHD